MKKLIKNWMFGLSYLIDSDLISFYAFFTVVLAECSYLWAFYESKVAIPITIILIGYILNVVVSAFLKGCTEGTKIEKIVSILYVIVFVILFIIGCIFNWCICTVTTVILLGVTGLWMTIRNTQYTFLYFSKVSPKIAYSVSLVNRFLYIASQILIIGVPFIVFTIFFAKISLVPILLKVIIPILYLIISPFIAYLEDELAACNVFELAYDITWSKEFEEYCDKLKSQSDKDINI